MKITVYVRPKDEALMNAVAGAKGKRLSGWAYEVLLREANREAARKKLPPPDPKQRKK